MNWSCKLTLWQRGRDGGGGQPPVKSEVRTQSNKVGRLWFFGDRCSRISRGTPEAQSRQARILEWVTFPFSRQSSQPGIKARSPTLQVDSLPAEPQGKPINSWVLCLFKYWETVEVIFLQLKDHDSKISSYIKLDGDIWYIIWGLSRHLQQQGSCPGCFPTSSQKDFLSKRLKEHFYIRVSSKIKRRGEDLYRTANSNNFYHYPYMRNRHFDP